MTAAIRIDEPVPGYYRMRLRKGGMHVAVRIWHGPPNDPVTGEELDRSWRFQAEINGRYAEIDRVWPSCAGEPIDEAEARYLTERQRWGEENAPDSPQANPMKRVNLLTAPLPF